MATTRLGQIGVGVEPYGAFAPKTAAGSGHTGQFTRLTQMAIMGQHYPGFAPKTAAGGGGLGVEWMRRRRRSRHPAGPRV
jgi:hypothetical protein